MVQILRNFGLLHHKWNIYITSLLQRHWECKSKRQWIITRKECLIDTAGQLCMWTHSGCFSMHKTCAVKAGPSLCMERRVGYEALPLAVEKMVAIREGESVFSKSVPPGNQLHYSARLLFQEYMASTNWTW